MILKTILAKLGKIIALRIIKKNCRQYFLVNAIACLLQRKKSTELNFYPFPIYFKKYFQFFLHYSNTHLLHFLTDFDKHCKHNYARIPDKRCR